MTQPLLQPFALGSLQLPNRVVMAPMTRCRADNPGNVPTSLMAEYYAQRASAGLLITEGTFVSRRGVGYINVPGIYSDEQVQGWRLVTDAVHKASGRIFCQLWHVGAMSHPSLLDDRLPVAPSAVNPGDKVFTLGGHTPTVTPQALSAEEVAATIDEFRRAAKNALAAGFDGIELHAANGYLFHQFFANSMNKRTDAYGGSIENRARFLFDVLAAVGEEIGLDRVGVRINPAFHGLSGIIVDEEAFPLFAYVAARLNDLGIAYLHVMEPFNSVTGLPVPQETSMAAHFRRLFAGAIVSATDYGRDSANRAIGDGDADLVAFGRAFIANSDLVERFRQNAPLNVPDRATFYSGNGHGYVDYPTLGQEATSETVSGGGRVSDRYGETRAKMKSE